MFLSRFRFTFRTYWTAFGRDELLIRNTRKLRRVHFFGQLLYLVTNLVGPMPDYYAGELTRLVSSSERTHSADYGQAVSLRCPIMV